MIIRLRTLILSIVNGSDENRRLLDSLSAATEGKYLLLSDLK